MWFPKVASIKKEKGEGGGGGGGGAVEKEMVMNRFKNHFTTRL